MSRYGILSILGISFWFFLGFPFANYHESYGWIAQYNVNTITYFIFDTIGHYSSYRPLGQVIAIMLYKSFNDSMALIQMFNYGITIGSFLILIWAAKEKKSLSVIFLIIGGFFFLGFSYLFHLHGLYYCPLLLLLSLLLYYSAKPFSIKTLVISFCISLIASLFHPLALFLFMFFLVGITIENRNLFSIKHYLLASAFIFICIGLVMILVPNQSVNLDINTFKGILNIYKTLDKNLMMSMISFLLGLITIRSISTNPNSKNYFSAVFIFLSFLLYYFSVPMIVVWFLACIAKVCNSKQWGLLFLLIITFFFPIFTGIESKHLLFLIVIVASYILSLNLIWFENKLTVINFRAIIIALIIVVSLILVLNQGVRIPIVSKITHPLLVEKEKTQQLDTILNWFLKSEYREYKIDLVSDDSMLLKSTSGKTSKQRLPTSNFYLNEYLNSIRADTLNSDIRKSIYVSFDNRALEDAVEIYRVEGKYGGDAFVYLSISTAGE